MAPTLVAHVVADAGAFLKKASLQDIGSNIYTLKDVVDEIRDKPTRRSLAFLPYTLNFKEPHPEHIRLVTEFSKKTGDYPSLSATDIKVLALTYQLELEHVGSQHLKKEPEIKVNIQTTQRHPETPVNVAGFHFPAKKPADSLNVTQTEATSDGGDEFNSFQFWREPLPSIDSELLDLLKADTASSPSESGLDTAPQTGDHSDDEDKENEPEDEEEEDGGGWITPSNIQQVKMESGDWTAPADVTVGCLTTDFAMQNVLIQMGLHVLSVNGMLIKEARNYILRCHACFKTTSNMSKVFCPHCGNKTLKKLAVTVTEDGRVHMHFSKNPKVLNAKGLRHSLPLPRGGKHSNNPQLVEDQSFPQQRLSRKARQKTDVFDPDYVAGGSPFCQNDIYSRAANLQIRDGQSGGGRRRTNPNATHKKFVKKK
ncbi:RNA-binding protein NOB1 isoform X2 [Sander lucioperca]|uniref:RNA-binding protein NOB1 isoform X2 n=1 Tax=Sander lucioperca TaxID=283035 RepID=UPI001653CA9E|nr:RNA-binding protein NOB1 isoform X2 [Sander lucioperca]